MECALDLNGIIARKTGRFVGEGGCCPNVDWSIRCVHGLKRVGRQATLGAGRGLDQAEFRASGIFCSRKPRTKDIDSVTGG